MSEFVMDMVDIEKHIEYALTLGLRSCFGFDELYKYTDDDLETQIIITGIRSGANPVFKFALSTEFTYTLGSL